MSFFKLPHTWTIKNAIEPEFSQVRTTKNEYLEKTPKNKIYFRLFRKYLLLLIFGQKHLEVNNIPINSRVLFLYTGKRNYGDALLELSGRVLLIGSKHRVDLLTLPHLAKLFNDDIIFESIYTDIDSTKNNKYDYILISEFNHKSISTKIKYFKNHKFACMFRFFYGPDRNQIIFSFFSINKIFNIKRSDEFILREARPILWTSKNIKNKIQDISLGKKYIVISIGGIDSDRTYNNWEKLLARIHSNNNLPRGIILLGSDNAATTLKKIEKINFNKVKITSLIGKTTLNECREIIKRAEIFIGSDGGLMHIAHTTNTRTITLFGKEPSQLRLTERINTIAIQAEKDVNEISDLIIYQNLLNTLDVN